MQFNIPKVVKPLFLRDYAEGFGVDPETGEDCPIWVWVNPPRAFLRERDEIIAEIVRRSTQRLIDKKQDNPEAEVDAEELIDESFDESEMSALDLQLREWLSTVWSQGPEGSQMSAEEIRQLSQQTAETDPIFFSWLQERTVKMILEHRFGQKKS